VPNCEPISGFDSARDEWSELADRSGNVFATWEWASAWWRHFAEDMEPVLLRCHEGDRPLAILPLYVYRRGPLRILRFIGHGPGDVLGPVCAAEDRGAVGAALAEALRSDVDRRWHAFLAERLPAGSLSQAIGGTVLQRESCPELEIGGRSWDEYLASCSRNLREKLRRNTRKIERQHELRYRLCDDPDRLDADMDTLFELHTARWGEGSSFTRPPVVAFHRDFAAIALKRGWLRLWHMEIDGKAAAAWYGFRFGEVEHFYQSGRDPRFDRYSAGFLMLTRTIQAAFDDELRAYSFLRGDEPYKDRFATSDPGLETRALGYGPLSATAIRAGSATLNRSTGLRSRVAALMR
jgi:CelD/BcsL family acetyltransferase involved in cellulose biosynthesis